LPEAVLQRQKETYYRGKKRPTIEAKRDLLERQKETYYRGKKRPTIEAKRDLL